MSKRVGVRQRFSARCNFGYISAFRVACRIGRRSGADGVRSRRAIPLTDGAELENALNGRARMCESIERAPIACRSVRISNGRA